MRQFVVIWQCASDNDFLVGEISCRIEKVSVDGIAYSVDVIPLSHGNGLFDFLSFPVVGKVAVVFAQVVVDHPARDVHHSHSHVSHPVLLHVLVHHLPVPFESQCLLHIGIEILESQVERLNLVLLFAVLLEYDKEYCKYGKQ